MAWFSTFLEKLFPTTEHIGGDPQAVVIDIPPDVYYESLAIYTAASLISNAIGHSEVRTYRDGKPDRTTDDYYLLNVAPNKNETSSLFWHRVINKMIYNGEALIVDAGGALYCADSFTRTVERPILGDIYGNVTVGNFTFNRIFTQDDAYLIRLDNIQVRRLIDGMYEQYKGIIASAAKAVQKGNGQKYKLHIQGTKAGDAEFNKFFAENISTQLKAYLENDNAVYPEFDGYELLSDPVAEKMTGDHSAEFLSLRKDLFSIVSAAFHIPDSMMSGNITNMSDIVGSFLTFGVDPYADVISEALNKRGTLDNYRRGNYYVMDTSSILHRDQFAVAANVSNLISSGVKSIDEVREMLGDAPLNTEWSQKHFITKNFADISAAGGEEKASETILPDNA